jgi:hypothetical protein
LLADSTRNPLLQKGSPHDRPTPEHPGNGHPRPATRRAHPVRGAAVPGGREGHVAGKGGLGLAAVPRLEQSDTKKSPRFYFFRTSIVAENVGPPKQKTHGARLPWA